LISRQRTKTLGLGGDVESAGLDAKGEAIPGRARRLMESRSRIGGQKFPTSVVIAGSSFRLIALRLRRKVGGNRTALGFLAVAV